jgi:hypothetical protein
LLLTREIIINDKKKERKEIKSRVEEGGGFSPKSPNERKSSGKESWRKPSTLLHPN